jgi:hypothetical protein
MDLERVLNVLRSVDFDRPQVLYLWLPGTLLALALLWALGLARRRIGKRRWGSRRAVERLGKGPSLTVEFLTFCALELSVALLVVAVAGPGLPNAPVPVVAKDLDIVFNFDVSRSLLDETYRSTMPPVDGKDPNDVPGSYGTDLDVLKLAVLKIAESRRQSHRHHNLFRRRLDPGLSNLRLRCDKLDYPTLGLYQCRSRWWL